MFSIEIIYSGVTCLGFAFLIPGMMLIVGGQNILQNKSFGINFSLYKQEEENMRKSNELARYLLENPRNSIQELSMKSEDEGEERMDEYEQESTEKLKYSWNKYIPRNFDRSSILFLEVVSKFTFCDW